MSVSPDVICPTTGVVGTVSSGWTGGETVAYFINGVLQNNFPADANGVLGVSFNSFVTDGTYLIQQVGQTSGRIAGGTFWVRTGATVVPGVAVAPHAVRRNGADLLYMLGTGYAASTNVTIRRNGVSLGTVMSTAAGTYYITISPVSAANTGAVYSSNIGAGTGAGQSVEERTDALLPPGARGFIDRAVILSTVSSTFMFVGEGFQAGETVTLGGCAAGSSAADANGSVAGFLLGTGVGNYLCTLTGATSGRIAYGAVNASTFPLNIPSAIVQPATVADSAGTVLFGYDRFAANLTGGTVIWMERLSLSPLQQTLPALAHCSSPNRHPASSTALTIRSPMGRSLPRPY